MEPLPSSLGNDLPPWQHAWSVGVALDSSLTAFGLVQAAQHVALQAASENPRLALLLRAERQRAGVVAAALGDDDLFAGLSSFQQLRQVCPSIRDAESPRHGCLLAS